MLPARASWDADHAQERILVRTRVSPDPRFVKWINPALTLGIEQDVVITIAEGGGMFAVAQETGQIEGVCVSSATVTR